MIKEVNENAKQIKPKSKLSNDSEGIYLKKKGEKYYQIINEPKYYIIRKLFQLEERDYTDFEKKKLKSFKENLSSDSLFNKKLKNSKFKDYLEKYLLSLPEETYRFLNMFAYDVDSSTQNMHKFFDIQKKLKFKNENLINLLTVDHSIPITNSFYLLGKDLQGRPIIGVDLLQYQLEILKKIPTKDLIVTICNLMNNVIKSELIAGVNEQITILLDIGEINHNDMIENYSEIIKLLQYLYPSRLHKMFISGSLSSNEIFFLLQKNLLEYNRDRIVIFDPKDEPTFTVQFGKEIKLETIYNFFVNKVRKTCSSLSDNSILDLKNNFTDLNGFHGFSNCSNKMKSKEIHNELSFNMGEFNRNIETDSHTKDILEVNSTIISKNGVFSFNMSNLKIANCQKFMISSEKLNSFLPENECPFNKHSKNKKESLSINKNTEFSLKGKSNSNSRRKEPIIIYENNSQGDCCTNPDECVIF